LAMILQSVTVRSTKKFPMQTKHILAVMAMVLILGAALSLKDKVCLLETREIRKTLRENGGVKSRAARALGITERILSYKISTYGLDDPA